MGELQSQGIPWNITLEAGTHHSQESLCLSLVPNSEKSGWWVSLVWHHLLRFCYMSGTWLPASPLDKEIKSPIVAMMKVIRKQLWRFFERGHYIYGKMSSIASIPSVSLPYGLFENMRHSQDYSHEQKLQNLPKDSALQNHMYRSAPWKGLCQGKSIVAAYSVSSQLKSLNLIGQKPRFSGTPRDS